MRHFFGNFNLDNKLSAFVIRRIKYLGEHGSCWRYDKISSTIYWSDSAYCSHNDKYFMYWIDIIVHNILEPCGYILNGRAAYLDYYIDYCDDDYCDDYKSINIGIIKIDNNKITNTLPLSCVNNVYESEMSMYDITSLLKEISYIVKNDNTSQGNLIKYVPYVNKSKFIFDFDYDVESDDIVEDFDVDFIDDDEN